MRYFSVFIHPMHFRFSKYDHACRASHFKLLLTLLNSRLKNAGGISRCSNLGSTCSSIPKHLESSPSCVAHPRTLTVFYMFMITPEHFLWNYRPRRGPSQEDRRGTTYIRVLDLNHRVFIHAYAHHCPRRPLYLIRYTRQGV